MLFSKTNSTMLSPTTVEWLNDEEGYIWNGISKTLCYKQRAAIERSFMECCVAYLKYPQLWLSADKMEERAKTVPWMHSYSALYLAYPKFALLNLRNAKIIIERHALLCCIDLVEKRLDLDAAFVASISKKRDWNHECCICLETEHMGHTCGCGYKEIVMFRPCGHSVCKRDCYWRVTNAEKKPRMMKTESGNELYVVGDCVADASGFQCPMCRTTVTKSIEINHASISREDVKDYIDLMMQEMVGVIIFRA
jgi:hypothetical protein